MKKQLIHTNSNPIETLLYHHTLLQHEPNIFFKTLNLSTHAYLAFGPLTCTFCQSIDELLFLKTIFLNMYVPCTTTSHTHMFVSPLQLAYIHMLHHYNPRILAKVAKNKKFQRICWDYRLLGSFPNNPPTIACHPTK